MTFYILGTSLIHYTGLLYGPYLPISDAGTYDNTGRAYNTSRILTPDLTLDAEAYASYSPLFISTTFAMSYGLSFAAIASLVVYTYLHHGEHILKQWRASTSEKADVHMRLMRRYPEAPSWWYMTLFALVSRAGSEMEGKRC